MLDPDDDTLLDALYDHCDAVTTEQHLFEEPVASLSLADPICVTPDDTVRVAVQTMVRAHIGAVPVVDDGRLIGIFTERDVLHRVTLQGVCIDTTPVRAVMTSDPVCIEPQTNRVTALREMIRHGFRHLCVVDEGRIVGIFSMRELVGFVQDLFPTELSAED